MKYKIYLKDQKNGKCGHFYLGSNYSIYYELFEGNNSCDCNRSMRLYGLDHENRFKCNTDENRIRVTKVELIHNDGKTENMNLSDEMENLS